MVHITGHITGHLRGIPSMIFLNIFYKKGTKDMAKSILGKLVTAFVYSLAIQIGLLYELSELIEVVSNVIK